MPYRVKKGIRHILHLPGGQRSIIYSWDGSFRVWDLERGTQVREEWKDKEREVEAIALSPDGKTVASGSSYGAAKFWNVNTDKVIKTLTGHTSQVMSVCWSPDGGRVASGSRGHTWMLRVEKISRWHMEDCHQVLGIWAENLGCQLEQIARNAIPGVDGWKNTLPGETKSTQPHGLFFTCTGTESPPLTFQYIS